MADDRLAAYFLDVGQGDCTFIVPPAAEGDPILFDCNDWYVAERFVANHGITRLEAVIASHLDRDHIRGIVPFLLNHFAAGRTLGKLVVGIDRQLKDTEQREIATLLAQAIAWSEHPPCPGFALEDPTRGVAPLTIARGSDWLVQLVLPFHATRLQALGLGGEDPNICSAVMRVSRGLAAILIGADATLASWEKLDGSELTSSAIRVSHHGGQLDAGSRWKTSEELYRAVGAKHAFISVGTNNGYGHPDPAQIGSARGNDTCRVRCTQLTSRCHPDPTKLRADALRVAGGVTWPYRHHARPGDPRRPAPTDECPCAGSIAAWIEPSGKLEVVPSLNGSHDRFLNKVARARCGERFGAAWPDRS